MTSSADLRRHSPAAERNREPILRVLRRVLPAQGSALEIACGTGQHAVHFAAGLPGWAWLPTDPGADALASVRVWAAEAALPNLQTPQLLDVMTSPWPVMGPVDGQFNAVFCANLLHIAPEATTPALLRGAALHLAARGTLVVYGPFLVAGQATAPGNAAFDEDLRARNPAWGLRWLHDVEALAANAGLRLVEQVPMPANNLVLVFHPVAL